MTASGKNVRQKRSLEKFKKNHSQTKLPEDELFQFSESSSILGLSPDLQLELQTHVGAHHSRCPLISSAYALDS